METVTTNYFELFGLPPRFAIDLGALEHAFRRLQGELHPDRHIGHAEMERGLALRLSTAVNDGYRTLRHPSSRAKCLMELAGQAVACESNSTVSPAFLMAQMEWHEAIGQARATRDDMALKALALRLRHEVDTHENNLAEALDARGDFQAAAMRVNELHFYERLRAEIDDALDQLDY